MPKGGRLRYVPMTRRLTDALREARHLRGPRVLCDGTGKPLTQKVIQVLIRRTARRANVKPGIHILRHYLPLLTMSCRAMPGSFSRHALEAVAT